LKHPSKGKVHSSVLTETIIAFDHLFDSKIYSGLKREVCIVLPAEFIDLIFQTV